MYGTIYISLIKFAIHGESFEWGNSEKILLMNMPYEGGTILTKSKKKFFIKLLSFITIIATFPVLIVGLFSYLKSSEYYSIEYNK